jgi:leucyl aminopeptidase
MITLQKIDDSGAAAHLYILPSADKLNQLLLSEAEMAYVKEELADEKTFLALPRLKSCLFLQFPSSKTEAYLRQEDYRMNGNTLAQAIHANKINTALIYDLAKDKETTLSIAEGAALGSYRFLKYRKDAEKEKHSLEQIHIVSEKVKKSDINKLNILVQAVFKARDLVNEPQSYLDAIKLADELQNMATMAGVKAEVFNKAKIEALKMGGLLAVNKGSQTPPTFTILEWKPEKASNKKPYILVGKGVVYDTGGLSLKPTPNSMDTMKCDMAGAAVVGAAMMAIGMLKLPLHVIALIPATDNRPGENAYTPGDVIEMYNGLKVEVLNTDAEGRMILADALSYAAKFKPELVFDFATLTGAAAAAIGSYGTVMMGTANKKTKEQLTKAGETVFERLVEFPFWDDYKELIKSDIADIKNIGGPAAGAITAGKFLEYFTDYPWMHFDIAGPAFLKAQEGYRSKNASGIGVRMLIEFFTQITEK